MIKEYVDDETLDRLNKETQEYISAVKESIINQYGKILPEFLCQLQQLQDFYFEYRKASEEQKRQKVIVSFDNGVMAVNQNLSAMLKISGIIDKLVKNFGLSPLAKSKIKKSKDDTEDTDDFFNEI